MDPPNSRTDCHDTRRSRALTCVGHELHPDASSTNNTREHLHRPDRRLGSTSSPRDRKAADSSTGIRKRTHQISSTQGGVSVEDRHPRMPRSSQQTRRHEQHPRTPRPPVSRHSPSKKLTCPHLSATALPSPAAAVGTGPPSQDSRPHSGVPAAPARTNYRPTSPPPPSDAPYASGSPIPSASTVRRAVIHAPRPSGRHSTPTAPTRIQKGTGRYIPPKRYPLRRHQVRGPRTRLPGSRDANGVEEGSPGWELHPRGVAVTRKQIRQERLTSSGIRNGYTCLTRY